MKKIFIYLLTLGLLLCLTACAQEETYSTENIQSKTTTTTTKPAEHTLSATILEITANSLFVDVHMSNGETTENTEMIVPYIDNAPKDLVRGDMVKIEYNGEILETYPLQITDVIRIERYGHQDISEGIIDGTEFNTHHFQVGWTREMEKLWEGAENNGIEDNIQHIPLFIMKDEYDVEAFAEEYGEIIVTDKFAEKFDEDFFQNKILLVVYVTATSGMDEFVLDRIQIDKTFVKVHIKEDTTIPAVTDDMAGHLIAIEIEPDKISGCTEFDADLNNPFNA